MSAEYAKDRARIGAAIDAAGGLRHGDNAALVALRERFDNAAIHLVVAGEFKRGKSTLINALIGAELLPSGVVPLTSVVTELRGGTPTTMSVRLESGEAFDAPLAMLASYVTETANPRNEKGVREVVLTIPELDPGMHLVDTPGVGSVYEHNSEVTMGYLPSADAVVFVISADQPLGRQELAFLQAIRVHSGKVFVALNKVDHLSPSELAQSREFLERELAVALGAVPPLFPLSARQGLRARLDRDDAAWQASGMAAFAAALDTFLHAESQRLWLRSMARRLGTLLAEAGFAVDLKIKALDAPREALAGGREALHSGEEELRHGLAYFIAALEYERRRVMREQVEPALKTLANTLSGELGNELAMLVREARHEHTAALRERLDCDTERAIRQACDVWRGDHIAQAEDAFDRAAASLWEDLAHAVDELIRACTQWLGLDFALPLSPMTVERVPAFHYKFWDAPPSMYLLGQRLAGLVPGRPGRALALRHARLRADDLIAMQSGRMRHDLDERLKARAQRWLGRATEYLASRMAAVETALANADQTQPAEQDIHGRREKLGDELARIRTLESTARSLEGAPV